MVRAQTGAGKAHSIRSLLTDGTLAEVIRFVPDGDIVNIRLGRVGKGDRIYFDADLSFQSISLSNQVTAYSAYSMSFGATWTDEDGAAGDPIVNTQFLVNPRNNIKSVMEVPPAYVTGIINRNWLGSAMQLELDSVGNGAGMHFLKFTVETSTVTRSFIVPAFLL